MVPMLMKRPKPPAAITDLSARMRFRAPLSPVSACASKSGQLGFLKTAAMELAR